MGGVKGVSVIRSLFYYFSARAAGVCPARVSEVPRQRAYLAAREPYSRRKKLTSVVPGDEPGGPLSSVAERSTDDGLSRGGRLSLRHPVSLSCSPQIQIRSLMLV